MAKTNLYWRVLHSWTIRERSLIHRENKSASFHWWDGRAIQIPYSEWQYKSMENQTSNKTPPRVVCQICTIIWWWLLWMSDPQSLIFYVLIPNYLASYSYYKAKVLEEKELFVVIESSLFPFLCLCSIFKSCFCEMEDPSY